MTTTATVSRKGNIFRSKSNIEGYLRKKKPSEKKKTFRSITYKEIKKPNVQNKVCYR